MDHLDRSIVLTYKALDDRTEKEHKHHQCEASRQCLECRLRADAEHEGVYLFYCLLV